MTLVWYLSRQVIGASLLVLFALVGITGFLTFVSQIHNIGTGHYTVWSAIYYSALTLPQNAYDVFPIAALIGSLIGLGGLAAHHELILMRAMGASVWRLAASLLLGGFVLAIVCVLIGEFVAPPAKRLAEDQRARALYQQVGLPGQGGVWMRNGSQVVHVLRVASGKKLVGVRIFQFGTHGRLVRAAQARDAVYQNGRWQLHRYKATLFYQTSTRTVSLAKKHWPNFVRPRMFQVLVVDPSNLSWRGLARYISYLRNNHLTATRYIIAFWHKVAVPFSLLLMVTMALPFSLGGMRDTGAGQRLAIGVVLGLGYYLLDRTLLESGQAFHFLPILSAWLPTLILGVVVLFLLRRAR